MMIKSMATGLILIGLVGCGQRSSDNSNQMSQKSESTAHDEKSISTHKVVSSLKSLEKGGIYFTEKKTIRQGRSKIEVSANADDFLILVNNQSRSGQRKLLNDANRALLELAQTISEYLENYPQSSLQSNESIRGDLIDYSDVSLKKRKAEALKLAEVMAEFAK